MSHDPLSQRLQRLSCAALSVGLMLFVGACGDSSDSAGGGIPEGLEGYVGNLADASYLNLRGKPARKNARGEDVSMEQFEGRFVWAEYAAPWCGPCRQQAEIIKDIDGNLGEDIAFLTVMTSEMGGYGHPATQETARSWASAHGLDAGQVLAADLTAITIPRHLLFSPQGHTLFAREGAMSAAEIREVAERRMHEWRAWRQTGARADWMTGL